MSTGLPAITKQRLRAALASAGAAPRRRLGQNFLLDESLLAAIVRDAEVQPGETVLEVGPGPGLLTRHLLAAGAAVVAVELDTAMPRVAEQLVERELQGGLRWIHGDVLAGGRQVAPEVQAALPGCARLVANLPYNVAASLLIALAVLDDAPPVQVVMIQREVGDRLLAGPGGKTWGPLGIVAQLTARVARCRKVPPRAFWPAPKVDSVVVRLDRRADRPSRATLEGLLRFLGLAFHNRRKTLANSVAEAAGCKAADVSQALSLGEKLEKARAESLSALQLCDLSSRWMECALGERLRPSAGRDQLP